MSNPTFTSASQKGGTVVPNRIFVGGISASTTEAELCALFQQYGRVKATKIIVDRSGIAKGYGFVTFDTEEVAQKVLKETEELKLKDRKLNIAPAVKKLNLPSILDGAQGQGSPVYVPREGLFQASYPVFVHQPMYLPQYYPTAAATTGAYPQYVYASMEPSDLYHFSQNVPSQSNSSAEYTDSSDVGSEGSKSYSKNSVQTSSPGSEYESRSPRGKPCPPPAITPYRYSSCGSNVHGSPVQPQPFHIHQLLAPKTGMAIMAYPSSVVVGTPTILHVKESSGDENEVTDLAFLHSPMPSQIESGTLTPPPTPLAPLPCDFGPNSNIETTRKN